jgi:hypothetical protein
MSDTDDNSVSTIDEGTALLSSTTFSDFCDKLRKDDPSVLPEPGQPLRITSHMLSEKEHIEIADALLENTRVTYLKLRMEKYTKSSVEAMAKYIRTSKHLQRIHWNPTRMISDVMTKYEVLQQAEDMLRCLLNAIQESTSLKELHIDFPVTGGPPNPALENMLTHTQSLRSLSLYLRDDSLENKVVAAASSGLKKNTTLRELTLDFLWEPKAFNPILTSLRNHPYLRRLCLRGHVEDLTGLDTLLLSNNSKITELEIYRLHGGFLPMKGSTRVLRALARHPTITKLSLQCGFRLGRKYTRLLRIALRNISSLHSLALIGNTMGRAELAKLAPALYHNKSIKVLDISNNHLTDMKSAKILRHILRSNKTMTALDLHGNAFAQTAGAVECIADGLGSNSTLLKIDLSWCALRDGGVSILAQTLGSRNTTLQKLTLESNSITSMGVGVLLETMEQSSHHITDLDLSHNLIRNEGATILARSLGTKALSGLKRLSLSNCDIGDDGFITLVSTLEHNTSLLHLDLRLGDGISERVFWALAESLPEIKVLQEVHFDWHPGLASAMPLLLEGLRRNTSLFRFHVAGCALSYISSSSVDTARCTGGWMQEIERVGYRNRFLSLIRAPKERLPPRGIWPHALALIATLPEGIFAVLRSKPNLVPSKI